MINPNCGESADDGPVAWAIYAENGNCRIWHGNVESAMRWSCQHGNAPVVPLYARPATADSSSAAPSDAWMDVGSDLSWKLREYADGHFDGGVKYAKTLIKAADELDRLKEASLQGVPEITDEQMIGVLHSLGIDTSLSVYGFETLQVAGTSVPGMKGLLQKSIACIQSGVWPAPLYCFDDGGNVVRTSPSAPQGGSK